MNVLQEMKEAKLSYLADVMSDYAKWLSETSSDQHIADSINEWASTIREVLTMTDGHFVIEKTLDIKRLENKMKLSVPFFLPRHPQLPRQEPRKCQASSGKQPALLHQEKQTHRGEDGRRWPRYSRCIRFALCRYPTTNPFKTKRPRTMTEQQRKAIEILNTLREPMVLSDERPLSEDDYFFLLAFVIDKPVKTPVLCPWPATPLGPFYENRYEVTCDSCDQKDEQQ